MHKMNLDILDKSYFKAKRLTTTKSIIIVSAGFEERCIAFLRKFSCLIHQNSFVIIFDYPKINTQWRNEIISTITNNGLNYITLKFDENEKLKSFVKKYNPNEIFLDISGIGRYNIFKLLHTIEQTNSPYHIIYTEANEYYPLKSFYDEIHTQSSSLEHTFNLYLDKETKDLVYSYECNILVDKIFMGDIEPGLPILLITFFGFKRSRLQIVLQSLDVDKKIFILSEPTRKDIKWRKTLQKIINYDLYQKNIDNIKTLKTSTPQDTFNYLLDIINNDSAVYTHNIKLVPLGSKLQTVACFYIWNKFKEISIIFSLPNEYYADKYSKGYKNTFIITNKYIKEHLK